MILKRRAPAKINLGLHVLRKRTDGYHDLETVFLRIPWADELVVRPADRLTLTCSDPALPTDEGNLVMKAAQRLRAECRVDQGAAVHLEKQLPYGAGLGSGSSDAATTLRALATWWGLSITEERLHRLAAELGADVPFFLYTGTDVEAAYATERGEQLTPLRNPVGNEAYRFPFALVVVVPPVHIATAAAYRWVEPSADQRADLRAVVRSNDLKRWRAELVNDFEPPILDRFPAVRAVKTLVLAGGARYAALSGSGAAVFGVFDDDSQAANTVEAARQQGHRAWYGRWH